MILFDVHHASNTRATCAHHFLALSNAGVRSIGSICREARAIKARLSGAGARPEPPLPDLDSLKRQRADLQRRTTSIIAALQKLGSLQSDVDKARSNLADHDADQADAMREWAETGREDDPPLGDPLSRQTLSRVLARAMAAVSQAGAAAEQLQAEQRQVTGELQRVSADIERFALDLLQAEHRDAVEDLTRFIVAEVQPKVAKVLGCRAMVSEMAQSHQASGRSDAAMALFQRGEAIGEVRPDVETNPTQAEVLHAASKWRQRFLELTGDASETGVSAKDLTLIGAAA